jgi:hypothetical protein
VVARLGAVRVVTCTPPSPRKYFLELRSGTAGSLLPLMMRVPARIVCKRNERKGGIGFAVVKSSFFTRLCPPVHYRKLMDCLWWISKGHEILMQHVLERDQEMVESSRSALPVGICDQGAASISSNVDTWDCKWRGWGSCCGCCPWYLSNWAINERCEGQ